MPKSAAKVGGITVPLSTVYAYYKWKGQDAKAIAVEYVQAWAEKVPSGTQMILSKMKCALADGPCGCAEDNTILKCTGPYPQVPIEVIMEVLQAGVAGVEVAWHPAPEVLVVDGSMHVIEFVGPAKSMYVKKV